VPHADKKHLDRQLYLDERKELYMYQQTAYDNFEKTLTALVGAFLAFSVAFLGLLGRSQGAGPPNVPHSGRFLIGAWLFFGVSLTALLCCFFVNARAFTIEIIKLEDALKDERALERHNLWRVLSLWLYGVAAAGFLIGLVLLTLFCKRNFGI